MKCKFCDRVMVEPAGPADASILLVSEYPTYEEVRDGIPFNPRTTDYGEILRKELSAVGIQFEACRRTHLWRHGTSDKTDKEDLSYHMGMLVKEMKDREKVLLFGKENAFRFGVGSIDSVSGLVVEHSLFPKGVKVMFSVSPAFILYNEVGELRLALEKFSAL